jgi:phosphoglycolate phosphatase
VIKVGFDFDQTLADSSSGILDCLRSICQSLHIEVSQDRLHQLSVSGLPLKETMLRIIPISKVELASRMFMDLYPTLGIEGTRIIKGVKELIQDLRAKQAEIYVLSAKSQENLNLSLSFLRLEVDQAIGGLNYQGKIKFIRKLNLHYYIGDQVTDIQAAEKAGSIGILVDNSSMIVNLSSQQARFQSIEHLRDNLMLVFKK